jgi:hypothetical protein
VKSGNARPAAPLSLALDSNPDTWHATFESPAEYLAVKLNSLLKNSTTTLSFTIQSYDNGVPLNWGQGRVILGLSPRMVHSTYLTHHFWSLQFLYTVDQGVSGLLTATKGNIAASIPEDGYYGGLFVKRNCNPSISMSTGDVLTGEYCLFVPDQSQNYHYLALDGPLKSMILGNCSVDGDTCQSKTPGQYASTLGHRLFPTNYQFRNSGAFVTTANTGACFFMLLVMHILRLTERTIEQPIQAHNCLFSRLPTLKLPKSRTKLL